MKSFVLGKACLPSGLRVPSQAVWLSWLIVTAAGLRVTWALFLDAQPFGDADHYVLIARNIASGAGFSLNGTTPTAYRQPGYPIFLSILFALPGEGLFLAKAANVALGTLAVLLTYLLSTRLGASTSASRMAAIALCIYPNHIAYSALLMSEPLFEVLLLIGVYILAGAWTSWRSSVCGGVIWGAACWVKLQALLIPPILVLFSSTFSIPIRLQRSLM